MTFWLPWAPYFGNGCASVETCCPGHLRSSNPSYCGQPRTNFLTPVRQWALLYDPSSVRSNVGNICKLSRISYTCASMKLCCVGPLKIQVDAMQAIPRTRENQSPFPVITWLNLSFASTSFSYQEAIFFGSPEYRIPAEGRRSFVLPSPK